MFDLNLSAGLKIIHRKSRLHGEEPSEIERVEATDTNMIPSSTSQFLNIFLEFRVAGRHSVTCSLSASPGAILHHRSCSRDLSTQAPAAAMGCLLPVRAKTEMLLSSQHGLSNLSTNMRKAYYYCCACIPQFKLYIYYISALLHSY